MEVHQKIQKKQVLAGGANLSDRILALEVRVAMLSDLMRSNGHVPSTRHPSQHQRAFKIHSFESAELAHFSTARVGQPVQAQTVLLVVDF